MARDVNKYLSTQQAKAPTQDIAREWAILEELYTKRLWHQVTLKVQELVKSPYLQEGTSLIDLYENFLAEIENKINPLSLVEIIIFVVKKITDYDKCLDFLGKTKEKVKENVMAVILCNIIIGQIKLNHGDLEGVKKLLEETDEMIESLDGITTVHGRYYQLCSDYHRVKENYALYYRDALRFLGCTELKTIPLEEQKTRAYTLSLAALLGDGVYNFGELLAHPILESLQGSDKTWIVDLLHAFNSGSLERYEELHTSWRKESLLKEHEMALREKINLLCLMEMTFKRPGNHRILTFSEIAKNAKIPEDQVELLVMKALSLGLVKGSIDGVDRKVHMHWVQPRVLDKQQIASMKQQLERWCQEVKSTEDLLQAPLPPILE